jgi:hypothetical protein
MTMAIMHARTEWYEAHDAADFNRVVALFTPTGTYQDPYTGGPISGEAIGSHYTQRRGPFTDRVLTVVISGAWSDTEAAARVTGSLRHIESGKVVTVDTGEFFTYDPESEKLSSVFVFFDPDQIRRELE